MSRKNKWWGILMRCWEGSYLSAPRVDYWRGNLLWVAGPNSNARVYVHEAFPTPTSNSQTWAGVWEINSTQLNSILTLSTHQIPQVKGWAPQGCPPLQMPITSPLLLTNQLQIGGSNDPLLLRMPIPHPGCYLNFWPTGCKSEVPTVPSWSSVNLLE